MNGVGTAAKWGAAVAGAAIAGGAALLGMANNAAANADRVDKMSQKIGISRKGFQEWDFILSQSGTSIEKMQVGMKTMVQRMDETVKGTGKGAEAFAQLGVSATDLNGNMRDQEDVFEELVRKMQELPEGAEKSQLAFDLFGKAGLELMPLLNSTGGSVEELKQKAEELGIVLSDEAIDAGVVFTDTMDQMQRSLGAVVTKVGIEVMPIIQSAADWVIANMPTIQMVVGTVFSAIGTFVKAAVDVFTTYFVPVIQSVIEWVTTNWPTIQKVIEEVLTRAKEVIETVTGAIQAIWENWGGTILTVAKTIWDGIKGVVESAMKIIQGVIDVITGIIKGDWSQVWEGIKSILSGVWDAMKSIVDTVINAIKGVIESVWNSIKNFTADTWDSIKRTVSDVVDGVKRTVTDVFENLKNTITRIWDGIRDAIKNPIEKARDIVKGAIDAIKGFFNFSIKWPKIPMPHFSVSPRGWQIGDLLKGSIPSLGISWYKEGGIFTQPTLFNTPYGMKGVGEAGAEAVLPIEKLPDLLGFDKFDIMIELLKMLLKKNSRIYLDGDTLIGELIDEVDKRLADKQVRSRLAYGGA